MLGSGKANFHPDEYGIWILAVLRNWFLFAENKNIAGEFKVEGHREKKSSEFLGAARIQKAWSTVAT